MTRQTLSAFLGLGLLAAAFAYSAVQVLGHRSGSAAGGGAGGARVVRFAHWQLEGGVRDAFDRIARDYEALHPGVRVEQIAIPERIYAQWLRTQLVGETAPDLIQIGNGSTDEILARYFAPLTEIADQPNPYNAGTAFASTPLRDTILDGLQSNWNYNANLLENFGVSVSMFTVRMYYNRDLWRRLLGDTPTPRTYDEFIALCERVRAASVAAGTPVLPVAGSRDNAPFLLDRLFASQTQRLYLGLDLLHDLRPGNQVVGLGLLRGDWSLEDPAYRRALEITREAGRYFQPGYTQLGRDDASFYFIQGRSMMIATGSWDSPGFRSQAGFEIGVFNVPVPSPDHERFGPQVLGPAAEGEVGTGLTLGLTRGSAHPELAVDFLRYLASVPGNTTFSRVSGWLPSVVGVAAPPALEPFLPVTEGYVDGFDLQLMKVGANTRRVVSTRLDKLVGAAGDPAEFRQAMQAELPGAIREDLGRSLRSATLNISRQDLALASFIALDEAGGDDAPRGVSSPSAKIDAIHESQSRREAASAWLRLELARLDSAR